MMAKRPEFRCTLVSFFGVPSSFKLKAMIRWTIGRRYANVFPEPVSACRKASLSSFISCGTVFFWMAVGAFISSFVARCWATRRERPRAWKFSASSDSGAFDGVAGSASSTTAGCSKSVMAVGFDVKRLDEIWPVFMAWLGAFGAAASPVLGALAYLWESPSSVLGRFAGLFES